MAFGDIELSDYLASPSELYTFTRGSEVWRYTNADSNISFGGFVYVALPISRGGIEQTIEMSRNPITLTLIKDAPMLEAYKSSPPSDVTLLTINKIHAGLEQSIVVWLGRISNVKFGELEASVNCEPVYTSMKRSALRRRYQTGCPHALYESQCGVNRAAVMELVELSSASGVTLSGAAFGIHPDGYFSGGYIEATIGVVVHRRSITGHVGAAVTINLPLPAYTGSLTIRAYPGCDHSLSTCNSKYNNADNFGGQPFFRSKNPMNGTSVY